ncbi:MAG: tetrahydromethanopterin S-methyltransferase subunit B [Methanosarcinales archaeon]|nr:tetrahydromethanopterin S-methyltransferase subunit B [Methanosarcinales archaeon]
MYAIIDLDERVAIDPYNGIIAQMDEDNVQANLAVVSDRIDTLEAVAGDLMRSLDPGTTPLISHPNREGIFLNLGKITNLVYGIILGLFISAIALYILYGGDL